VSLAHKGAAAYRNDFDLVLRRESANANDLWQADHTELDVMVLDESDRPARPWFVKFHIIRRSSSELDGVAIGCLLDAASPARAADLRRCLGTAEQYAK